MGIRILHPGLMTTIQDGGRSGYQSQGFSVSGAMDSRSFRLANLLLDNPTDEAVLEFSLVGPSLAFTQDTIIAITGGDFQPKRQGQALPMNTAIYMTKGDVLTLGGARTGAWGYISFSSRLQLPKVMGSYATNTKIGLGGFKGRPLQAGDLIPFRDNRPYLPYFLSRRLTTEGFDRKEERLRVILGPQDHLFTREGLNTFLNATYTVTPKSDRMGYRLEGPPITHLSQADIISDGTCLGSIQVPTHGKPIILLADRQTTGGYAKIATVISVDLPKLVQRQAGHKIRFQAISVQEAQDLLREEEQAFNKMREAIHQPCQDSLTRRPTAKRLADLFK